MCYGANAPQEGGGDRTAGVERRCGGSGGASNGDVGREDLSGLPGA